MHCEWILGSIITCTIAGVLDEDISTYYIFSSVDMEAMAKLCKKVLSIGAHVHGLYSPLQFGPSLNMFSNEVEKQDNSGCSELIPIARGGEG